MAKSKMKRKRAPKSVLKLPHLEQSKSAVLNSLTSPSSQRTYDPCDQRIHRVVLFGTEVSRRNRSRIRLTCRHFRTYRRLELRNVTDTAVHLSGKPTIGQLASISVVDE